MSVLAKIRSRAILLVAIIAIALFAFVLGDLLNPGKNAFMGNDDTVAEIADHAIKYNEFNAKMEDAINRYKNKSKEATVDEQVKEMVGKQAWEQMVNDIVMKKEFKKLGITVSDDELYDVMLGANPHPYIVQIFTNRETGKIREDFATPYGQLDVNKIAEYIRNVSGQAEQEWVSIENVIRDSRIEAKYYNMIKKGLYVTTNEAKREYIDDNKICKVKYVMKRYSYVADSTIKITEDDAKKYYNAHANEFKVKEAVRKIEYVLYNAVPTNEDTAYIKDELADLTEEFKIKKNKEDSSFVARESDSHYVDNSYHTKGSLSSPLIDSILFNAEMGTVYGPYIENNQIKLSKLVSIKNVPDSVKARHILIKIANNDTASAMAKADSLKKISTDKNFADLAKKFSEDPGSGEKGGDLGWFTEGAMVPQFSEACFNGKKGDKPVVLSQFGVHLIEIMEKSPEVKKVKIYTIDRAITPGNKTLQKYYQQASEFAGKNNTKELFEKAVEEEKLDKRVADNIKESDKVIPGLDSPREVIRWMYEAKPGTVSGAFDLGNKFIVAQLTEAKEKGIAPFEQVKEQAEAGARQDKKAEQFTEQFKKVLSEEKTIDNIAIKMDEQIMDIESLKFSMNSAPGIGREGALIGTAVASKPNIVSQPVKGRVGVYVVLVQEVKQAPPITDYTATKNKLIGNTTGKVDNDVFEALKETANIIDNRAKFGY